MAYHYLVSAEGEVSLRIDGDPWSDSSFYVQDIEAWIQKKLAQGYKLTRYDPPLVQKWGGPADPPVRVRHVIASLIKYGD